MIRTYESLVKQAARAVIGGARANVKGFQDLLTAVSAIFTLATDLTTPESREAAWKAFNKDLKAATKREAGAYKASASTLSQIKRVCLKDTQSIYLAPWAGVQTEDGEGWESEPDYTVKLRDVYDMLGDGKAKRQPSLQEALERAAAKWNKAQGTSYAVVAQKDGSFTVAE